MNNERYNQIIDEAYEDYWSNAKHNNSDCLIKQEEGSLLVEMRFYYKQEFINKCKTNLEFSEKWGLKIVERELSQRERVKLLQEAWKNNGIVPEHEEVSTLWVEYNNLMTKYNIPVKIITVTYKDEKIEVYE